MAYPPQPPGERQVEAEQIQPDPNALTRFKEAWRDLLESDEEVQFESLQHELVVDAWEKLQRNQVRTAKHLNISRNILRTYLKKGGVL